MAAATSVTVVYLVIGLALAALSFRSRLSAQEQHFRVHRLTCDGCAEIREGTFEYRMHVVVPVLVVSLVTTVLWLPVLLHECIVR